MLHARRFAAACLAAASLAATSCSRTTDAPSVTSEETKPSRQPAATSPPAKPPVAAMPEDTEVKTMPNGLKYSVLKAGTGQKPGKNDSVRVHYTGWLVDGKEFDSSRSGGEPAEFQVGQVIQGWQQALQEMPAGSRWKITIPPELGYGAAGSPPVIPPNATLVFDVELIGVRSAPPFCAVDAAAAKTTESGVLCQVLEPGTGAAPAEEDAVELEYTIWSAEGDLLRASAYTGETIQGRKADMRMPFLKELPYLLKEGGSLLAEVPQAAATKPGAGPGGAPNAKTIWRLKLLRVGKARPAPMFVLPQADSLTTTPSGLQIQVLAEGKGEPPAPGDSVVVEYAGWLTDGTLFDCSHQRGLPATFKIGPGRLIEGWNEGLRTMKPGGTSLLVVPAKLAYGDRAQGAKIPPNSTLVFRIELLEVKK